MDLFEGGFRMGQLLYFRDMSFPPFFGKIFKRFDMARSRTEPPFQKRLSMFNICGYFIATFFLTRGIQPAGRGQIKSDLGIFVKHVFQSELTNFNISQVLAGKNLVC